MLVDLPAFDRPTKAISGTSSAGRWLSCGAVVKKRAVCSQFSATSARESGVAVVSDGVVLGFKMTSKLRPLRVEP